MRNEVGHFPEVCKKSLQAQLTDIQAGIPATLFDNKPISEFAEMPGRALERLGRLNTPLYKNAGDRHYTTIGWDEALQRIIDSLRQTDPDRSFFYASGRSSNEAAFLLQLFVRLYGSNNVNNCSYYCHQASGVGLAGTIGTGTATVQLADLKSSDCIFVIGANPASNHPRFMAELMHCRRRGGDVIVINPLREPGLESFIVPSDVRSMLGGGSEIASLYLQPHIGGDIALLAGIAKAVIENKAADTEFIAAHSNNYDSWRSSLDAISWQTIEENSGLSRPMIQQAADKYCRARNVVFTWAMGLTHHKHGVANIEAIVNLALLRGMIGRPGAGLLPLRGHSNVQGVGSVGVTPVLKEQIFSSIEKHYNVKLPTKAGMDTMACMRAAAAGDVDFALMLGGNLYASNPDLKFAARALGRVPMKVFMTTTLNAGHFNGVEAETIVLPVAARDEEKQRTTQESMFNFVRLSDGGIVRLDNVRSEVDIIADIAAGVLHDGPLDFKAFKNYDTIRDAIAKTVPGYAAIADINETKEEFQIDGRTLHTPRFNTPDARARFSAIELPLRPVLDADEFLMMTVRSEGQFNTVVYEDEDAWRGQSDRWIVMMNPVDIKGLGLTEGARVRLESATGAMDRVVVRAFDVHTGNVVCYFPEANVLIPSDVDERSKTPAFKSVRLRVIVSGS